MTDPVSPIPFRWPWSAFSADSTYASTQKLLEKATSAGGATGLEVYSSILAAQATIDAAYIQGWFTLFSGITAIIAAVIAYRVTRKQIFETERHIEDERKMFISRVAYAFAHELSHNARMLRRGFPELLKSESEAIAFANTPKMVAGRVGIFGVLDNPTYNNNSGNISVLRSDVSMSLVEIYNQIAIINRHLSALQKWYELGYHIDTTTVETSVSVGVFKELRAWKVVHEGLEVNAVVSAACIGSAVIMGLAPQVVEKIDILVNIICRTYQLEPLKSVWSE